MKLEIVKFANGTYGVRKRDSFFRDCYLDLDSSHIFWRFKNEYDFSCAMGTEEQAREGFAKVNFTEETVIE